MLIVSVLMRFVNILFGVGGLPHLHKLDIALRQLDALHEVLDAAIQLHQHLLWRRRS